VGGWVRWRGGKWDGVGVVLGLLRRGAEEKGKEEWFGGLGGGGGLEGVGFAGREEGMARGREAGSGVDVLVLVLVDGAGRVRVTSPRFLGSNLESPTMYGWPPVLVSVFNFLHSLD